MKAKVRVSGANQVLRKFIMYKKRFTEAERVAVEKGGVYLESIVRREMSHTAGYSGDPYSRVKNPSGINSSLIKPLKDYAIRKRTGKLLAALSGKMERGQFGFEYTVGMDASKMPDYGLYVFQGTRIMHPRDPITGAYTDKNVQAKILSIVSNELKKSLEPRYLRF